MRARKRFGQHFLEPAWSDKLVGVINPRPGDRFVEIGPGPGALTLRLAPRVAHLTAIEVDRDLADALRPRLPPNVDLVTADFLSLDLSPFFAAGPVRVAGNLPYNISSPILFRLIALHRQALAGAGPAPGPDAPEAGPILDATLMVQREVADRLEAVPGSGDYGVLAISVQRYAGVTRLMTLPPGAFRPAPRVHSAVVGLRFRPPAVAVRDERLFDEMVRSMFTQRRKTLGNALSGFASRHGVAARAALARAGIGASRRPETLQLTELARLADEFSTAAR